MTQDVYKNLMAYLEFPEDEIQQTYEDMKRACAKCDLTEEDVKFAYEHWIPENWNAEYKGVRMGLGVLLREFIALLNTDKMKEAGKKIVYGILPAHSNMYYALKFANPDVYIAFPDALLVIVLQSIFHKASPLMEQAEEEGISQGCRHCPLNKTRYSAFLNKMIATPDIIWSWGFNCDEGPKTDELIQNMLGEEWQYVISRAPHDSPYGVADDTIIPRMRHVADEIKAGMEKICEVIGAEVKQEHFKRANDEFFRATFKVSQLTQMVCKADPPVLTGNTLAMFASFQLIPFNGGLAVLEKALDTLIVEIKDMIKQGKGILPKGSPKVAMYFNSFIVTWYDRVFRDNGVCTTYSLTTTPVKNQLKKEYLFPDDPYMVMAENWLRRGTIQNLGSDIDGMVEKIETNTPDGVVMGFFDFDRWLGAHQKLAAKKAEERTGVPHFYMECDFWDDRDYSEEAMKTRVESICQVLKMRKDMAD